MQTDDMATTEPAEAEAARDLRIGELVELRSVPEILATLDGDGRLEGLPFMPEMLPLVGQQLRVDKRAFKTCDQFNNSGMFHMERTVHLQGVRCDGSAHGGCQAGCLLHFKEAWLRRVEPGGRAPAPVAAPAADAGPVAAQGCTLATLQRATRVEPADGDGERFSCQATELPKALGGHIRAWDPRQYVEDVRSGNVGVVQVLRGILILVFNKYQRASRRLLPRRLRIQDGANFPFLEGTLEGKTPKELLDLQPGELVEVRSKQEIVETLDKAGRNRGLRFDVEMLRYCGKRARVLRRVNRLIDEKTGKMIEIKGDCIVLDGVICQAAYHQNCPRGIFEFWREIWLRRVD